MKLVHSLDQHLSLRFHNGLEVHIRDIIVSALLLLLSLLLFLTSLHHGITNTGIADFWNLITGHSIAAQSQYVLLDIRLPRLLVAFLIGWSVALSGAILQPIARNPLADPGLFGISHGSLTTTMLLLAILPDASKILVMAASLIGGFGVALLLLFLVGNRNASGFAILLMGIALATILASINSFLILYLPSEASYNIANWMAGSLFQANWDVVFTLLPLVIISLIGILFAGRSLNRLELGNELALALGEPLHWSRPILLFFAVLLSAAAVTIVGPLAFLAILASQITHFLTSAMGSARLFLCGLVGANLVLAADMMSKSSLFDLGLPLGLSFTLLGVPLFIIILNIRALRNY